MSPSAPVIAKQPIAYAKAGSSVGPTNWYSIKMLANGDAQIDIEGEIGIDIDWWTGEPVGMSAPAFAKELRALGNVPNILVTINSPGGNVFDASQIYSLLKQCGSKITVRVGALAASAASVIAMAGDIVEMSATSLMMIHNPWTVASGDSTAMRSAADMLDKIREAMMTAYKAKVPSLGDDLLIQMLNAETWMTGEDAIGTGFCDSLVATEPAEQAMMSMRMVKAMGVRRVPKAVTVTPTKPVDPIVAAAAAVVPAVKADATEGDDDGDMLQNLQTGVDGLGTTLAAILQVLKGDTADDADASTTAVVAAAVPLTPINKLSSEYAGLLALATKDGRVDEFNAIVAAGASLEQVQMRIIDVAAMRQVPIAGARNPGAAAPTNISVTAKKTLDPDAIYANLYKRG